MLNATVGYQLQVFQKIDLDSSGTLELEELETAARECPSCRKQSRLCGFANATWATWSFEAMLKMKKNDKKGVRLKMVEIWK